MPEPRIISSLEWTEQTSSRIIVAFSSLSLSLMFAATVYGYYKLRVVRKDIDNLDNETPRRRMSARDEICKALEKKYFRISGLSALLAVVISYMSPTSVWPQPQVSLAILAVLQAQASSTAFCDTNQDEIIDKIMDVLAVMATLTVVITVSYKYEWATSHNPRTFTIIAFVMEISCSLIWIASICLMRRQVHNNRPTFERVKIIRDAAVGITVGVTSIVAIAFGVISFKDSYKHDVNYDEPTIFADPIIIALCTLVVGIILQAIVVAIGRQRSRLEAPQEQVGLLEMIGFV